MHHSLEQLLRTQRGNLLLLAITSTSHCKALQGLAIKAGVLLICSVNTPQILSSSQLCLAITATFVPITYEYYEFGGDCHVNHIQCNTPSSSILNVSANRRQHLNRRQMLPQPRGMEGGGVRSYRRGSTYTVEAVHALDCNTKHAGANAT
jgi:hypothetical protein